MLSNQWPAPANKTIEEQAKENRESSFNSNLELIELMECQNTKIDSLISVIEAQQELLGNQGVIKDGHGEGNRVKVSSRGQLVTAPLDYSTLHSVTLAVAGTVYNLALPVSGKQFVITDLILYADKNVGTNDASIEIFGAGDGPTGVNALGSLIELELPKKNSLVLTGLNIVIGKGLWLNATTNDNIVYINIAGYYVDQA
jgi:hypothetical protein